VIEFARFYATQGWRVFPLSGKVPAIPKERGGRGCLDATLDLNRIDQWWSEYPNANIGLATGAVLVIDVDPRKCATWLESLNELALPQTFTVRTWSKGFHLYFKMPADSRITIGANLLPGIDWRGRNGYVVAAGSVVNGATYEIVRNAPIEPAPRSLIERIEAHAKKRIVEYDDSGNMIIPDGRRNATLFKLGCALRRFGVGYNAMLESLRAVNTAHCDGCLDDEELRTIAASAARYAPTESPQESA
jgi:putative DNA primase/helicase